MLEMNKIMLIGNLTADPEIRNTANGAQVANVRLAVNETWKGADGQKREDTCFVDCEAWGKQAEFAGQYLAKGKRVYVEGSLKLDEWQDQQTGQKRSRHKIKAHRILFAEPPQNGNGGGGYQQQAAPPQQGYAQAPPQQGYAQAPPPQGYAAPQQPQPPAPWYQAPPQQYAPKGAPQPQQPAYAGQAAVPDDLPF